MLKLLKLFRYLRAKEWLFCLFSLVFVCAQVVLELMIPDYMSEITTLIETPGSAMGDVWSAGGMMLLCAFGSLVSSIAVCFFASRIAANFSKRLRKEMFYKVESFTLEEINAFSTASLITRSTNDVVQVQMLVVLSLQVVVKAPLMAVWAIMKIAGKAWQWSLATGIAVVLLVAILSVAVVRTFPRFKRIQWLQDSLNQSARENLTGIRVVHAYNAEEYQEKKFEKVNTELLNNSLFANRTMTILSPFMSLVMNCLNMSIYWIGAVLINAVAINGAASVAARVGIFADMIVFMSYAMQVIMSFIMIVMVIIIMPRALEISHSADFVSELEDKENAHMARGGTNFSGGQKQRLSIARALCRDCEILIFDDTFSALDFKTDRELRDALKDRTAGQTKLIVAQRIGTIMSADRIVVLDEGQVVGIGTHRELLKSCEVYRQIALSQLSEEELAI